MAVAALWRHLSFLVVFLSPLVAQSLQFFEFSPPPPMKPGWDSLTRELGLKRDIQKALNLSPEDALTAKAAFGLEPQPQYAGPVNYQANLSIPVNATPGANQASAPLAALMQPTPFQVPPDIYEARNSLQDTNSTCLVVVQPYLKMVLRSLSAGTHQVVVQPYLKMVLRSLSTGTSKYIKSAAPLPIEWRYMMKLSIHNSGPLDVQPPWQLTIFSQLFLRFLAAYNARIASSNTTSGLTTFEVTEPRFVLQKRENSVVNIVFMADALSDPGRAAVPHWAAVNGHPCRVFFNRENTVSVSHNQSLSGTASRSDQLAVSQTQQYGSSASAPGASKPGKVTAESVSSGQQQQPGALSVSAQSQAPLAAQTVSLDALTAQIAADTIEVARSDAAAGPSGGAAPLTAAAPKGSTKSSTTSLPGAPAPAEGPKAVSRAQGPAATAAPKTPAKPPSPPGSPAPANSAEAASKAQGPAAATRVPATTRSLLESKPAHPKPKHTPTPKPANPTPEHTPPPEPASPKANQPPSSKGSRSLKQKQAAPSKPAQPSKKTPQSSARRRVTCHSCAPPTYTTMLRKLRMHQALQPQQGARPISASAGQLYGTDGNPVILKGINWFGFETSSTMVAGLWAGSTSLTQDFKTIVWRIKLLGFNAVRLPFSFNVLFNYGPNYITTYCNPVGTYNLADSITAPGFSAPSNNPPQPPQGTPQGTVSSQCNSDVPSQATYQRFLFVVRYFTANGFYVLLDNQFNADASAKTQTGQWLQWWQQVLGDVIQDPASRNQVMLDLLNEPDSQFWRWEDVGPVYLQAMDALHQISPTTLFFIEGSGQSWNGAMCWGDGFITDRQKIDATGMSDPNPFFIELVTKPYAYNVVISPHYYPPSISHATSAYTGAALYDRMSSSFGYLNKIGYNGFIFPIVIGESGSRYTDEADISMLHDMAKYLANEGDADDGRHNPIPHLFWWAWNSNSADTGGLVSSPNWDQILWPKINYLVSSINLSPWYLQSGSQGSIESVKGKASIESVAGETVIGAATTLGAFTASRITSTTGAIHTTAPEAPVGEQAQDYYPFLDITRGNCTAAAHMGPTHWSDYSKVHHSVLELVITNYEAEDIQVPFYLSIYNAYYGRAAMAVNWRALWLGEGAITGVVEEDWAVLRGRGRSKTNVIIHVAAASVDLWPAAVLLNNALCTVVRS